MFQIIHALASPIEEPRDRPPRRGSLVRHADGYRVKADTPGSRDQTHKEHEGPKTKILRRLPVTAIRKYCVYRTVAAWAFNLSPQEKEAGGSVSLRLAWATEFVPG